MSSLNSCIYQGEVFHQRFTPKKHRFSYRIFFLAIDLDELTQLSQLGRYFKTDGFAPLRFFAPDYLQHKQNISKQDVWDKVVSLGGDDKAGKILFIGQMRCFGLYFSPINSYYCYDQNEKLAYLLAEVSNTPWNERQYYLIDVSTEQQCEKTFHVSPFMDLNMRYHWRIKAPAETLSLTIENVADNQSDNPTINTAQRKMFTASINMKRQAFTNKNLLKNLLAIPMMTAKTVLGIYWQALKLYIKGVPYVAHSKKENHHVS
ncbi:DUF1365 domain-containing protein [Psychromonas sp. psych-6C06]|uniref:DUF1365 domain-containing protein n=1 Tax=Psychromonas sp. psych-6C06 TaxID=2058089 RepID=UPI000C320B38|nr:DUF1365 domain-containing protein [Psychromonas sp. psych-6C06]PKF63349.1 DUF1365 domain-containing protein [Psychromonas sp. psych-6C06]